MYSPNKMPERMFCHTCAVYRTRDQFSKRQWMRARLLPPGPAASPYPGEPILPRCKHCLDYLQTIDCKKDDN